MPSRRPAKKTKISDLPKSDFDQEIVLKSVTADTFENDWCASRGKGGSTVVSLSKSTWKHPNPLVLTKVGHGYYSENHLAMTEFFHITNKELTAKFQLALETLPSIKRINLYACKSGMVPVSAQMMPLSERLEMAGLGKSARYKYGALSYAEYFILELRQAFHDKGQAFPRGLCLVAAGGDVKENAGKVAVSRGKRAPQKESFNEVDVTGGLVQINCDAFLASYDLALAAKRTPVTVEDESQEERKVERREVVEEPMRPVSPLRAHGVFAGSTSSSSSSRDHKPISTARVSLA